MKTFIISDTHFNHTNIIKYEGRPENFNEIIINNWNKVVSDGDLVIHLGDVILGKQSELPSIMAQLKGTKVLCRGNHDDKPNWYMNRGFAFACDYFVTNGIAYSHVPLTLLPDGIRLNIHGHFHRAVHRNPNDDTPDLYDKKYYREHESKYKLIQIEDSLAPFLLETVLANNP